MYLRPTQFEKLSQFIIKHLEKKGLLKTAQKEEDLAFLISSLFKKNLEEEDRLNADALQLLNQNKNKIGLNIDEERALGMIKRQLAKERNFVL